MPSYAVTLVTTLTAPAADKEVDAVSDLLGETAAVAVSDTELSVITEVAAEDPTVALSLATLTLRTVAGEAGLDLDELVQAEVTEWSRHEATLEESNLPDLVSSIEVAEILGVSKQRVYQLNHEHRTFPPPLLVLGSGPVWLRATIEAFDRTWERRAGRPRMATPEELLEHVAEAGGNYAGQIRDRMHASADEMNRRGVT